MPASRQKAAPLWSVEKFPIDFDAQCEFNGRRHSLMKDRSGASIRGELGSLIGVTMNVGTNGCSSQSWPRIIMRRRGFGLL